MLATTRASIETDEIRGIEVYSVETGSMIAEHRLGTDETGVRIVAAGDAGFFVSVAREEGGFRLLFLTRAGDEHDLVSGDTMEAIFSPSGAHGLVLTRDFALGEIEFSIVDTATGSVQSALVAFDDSEYRLSPWIDDEVALVIDADGSIWKIGVSGDADRIGSFDDEMSWGWHVTSEAGGAIVSATSLDSEAGVDKEMVAVVGPAQDDATHVIDGASIFARWISDDGTLAALEVLEDAEDVERILYVYSTETQELEDVDEGYRFRDIRVTGEAIVYNVWASDDPDDVEARRYVLGSGERPEVLYEEAYVLIGRGGE